MLRLEYRCDESLCISNCPLLFLFALHLRDTLPSVLRVGLHPADFKLFLAHSRVDVDVLDFDIERAMLWNHEPRINLPDSVQKNYEGPCKIVLEEGDNAEIGPANGPKGDVELSG
jgi:hypothetical protein